MSTKSRFTTVVFSRSALVVVMVLAVALVFLTSPSKVEAHGTRGPEHTHFDGYGISFACVDLGGNPFGYYKKIHRWPNAYFNYNGNWHIHYPYSWDDKGHVVGGRAIGYWYVCGL